MNLNDPNLDLNRDRNRDRRRRPDRRSVHWMILVIDGFLILGAITLIMLIYRAAHCSVS